MNCVSYVVIFFYLLELTLKTQVSNTVNTVGISSNALFGNSANNFCEPLPFSSCKTFINIRSSLLIRLPFCICLRKNYVNGDAQCADVNIGGRKQALRMRYYWQNLSNGHASCREISHKHCK